MTRQIRVGKTFNIATRKDGSKFVFEDEKKIRASKAVNKRFGKPNAVRVSRQPRMPK